MALAEQAELVATLSLRDQFSAPAKRLQNQLKTLDRSTQRTQASLSTFSRNLKLAGAGLLGLGALSVKVFTDYEDQLATINTVANVTPERLDEIGRSMRALAMETGASLNDLAAGYYDLVSAGVDAADAQDVLTQAVRLGIGGLGTTAETVDLLTTALNSYGLKASEVQKVTDGFAQTIALGKVTASELAESFARVAPIASANGIAINELQAAYASLTAQGVPAAEVATQTRAALVSLLSPSKDLADLQDRLGVNFAKLAKQRGLQVALQRLRVASDRLGLDNQRLLGRVEAVSFMFAVTGENAKSYEDALKAVNNASADGGVALKQFEQRQKTLRASFNRIRETGRDVAITFGTAIAPSVGRASRSLLKFVQENRPQIATFAGKIGELLDKFATEENFDQAFRSALTFLRDLPWSSINSGLSLAAQATDLTVKAFNALPRDMQNALIAILAANKLTGGLVTSVLGDLAGLALRNLTTINAANVTVIAGRVSGGGSPTGVPVPGAPNTVRPGPPTKPGPVPPTPKTPKFTGRLGFLGVIAASILGPSLVPGLDWGSAGFGIGLNPSFEKGSPEERRFSLGRMGLRADGTNSPGSAGAVAARLGLGPSQLELLARLNPLVAQLVEQQINAEQTFETKYDELINTSGVSVEKLLEVRNAVNSGKQTYQQGNTKLEKLERRAARQEALTAAQNALIQRQNLEVKLNLNQTVSAVTTGDEIIRASTYNRLIIR